MCNYALLAPEVKQAAQLYESGLSITQVAQRFHVSRQAVVSALKLMGVKTREKHEARRLRWKMQ
jgi:hypothetical protein